MAELLRLGVVLLLTAAGFVLGPSVDELFQLGTVERTQLIGSVLGALLGYVLGGVAGRAIVSEVDTAAARLERVASTQLLAAAIGAAAGGLTGLVVLLPVLLLPFQQFTVPLALLVILALAYVGGRLGATRGADLGRWVGMRGRIEVSTPSRGRGVKLVDTSALVDARLVEVARAGFLEGTLVVPTFVVAEAQTLADSSDAQTRRRGRRALDAVRTLQDDGTVAVEITEDDDPRFSDVDAKLTSLCRQRHAQLLTCDGGLERVAEIGGVRVLNLHALADAVRPPVLPGESLTVTIVRTGREPNQGIAYLEDGTMVVVDGGADRLGRELVVDVTSIVNNRQGRLLFARPHRRPETDR